METNSNGDIVMQTAEAVEYALSPGGATEKGLSKYRLAKNLGMAGVASINQWLRGTRMNEKSADKFKELYNITISDVYEPLSSSNPISE